MKRIIYLIPVLFLTFPILVGADTIGTCDTGHPAPGVCNPTTSLDLSKFISNTMVYVGTIIGLIAIAVIVYAGFRMVTANGDQKVITSSKNALTYTIAGFVISVMAYALVLAVENFIGVRNVDYNKTLQLVNPLVYSSAKGFVNSLLINLLSLSGIVAVVVIIVNGFRYATARGDDKQVSAAKTALQWAVVGLAIIIFAYVIIKGIASLIT